MRVRDCLLAASIFLGTALPAAAATVTYDVSFGADTFTLYNGSKGIITPGGADGAGHASVSGDFSVTLDPSKNYADQTAGITLNHIQFGIGTKLATFELGSPLAFSYDSASGEFSTGGLDVGVNGITAGANDFSLTIDHFTAGPLNSEFAQLSYAQSILWPEYFFTDGKTAADFAVVAAEAVAATPIPATLPLFISALGGLGFVGWRRRQGAA